MSHLDEPLIEFRHQFHDDMPDTFEAIINVGPASGNAITSESLDIVIKRFQHQIVTSCVSMLDHLTTLTNLRNQFLRI